MRKIFMLLFIASLSGIVLGQENSSGQYLALSGGKVFFGTGDITGYGMALEASKNLVKKRRTAVKKLNLGVELVFENGVRTAQTYNPDSEDFISQRFCQVSNTSFVPKLSYYPFGGVLQGFHVAAGPALAYTIQSREDRATRTATGNGYTRYSVLDYNKGVLAGYRIGAGFELTFGRKLLAGLRADFSNYHNGDVNTFAGLRLGVGF